MLLLRDPGRLASKHWSRIGTETHCIDYSLSSGPFAFTYAEVPTLDALEDLLRRVQSDVFHVRGKVTPAFAGQGNIPYRRDTAKGIEPPTLEPCAHNLIPIDWDGDPTVPMLDLPSAALYVRSLLPEPFRAAECLAQATSSAGVVPGIRLRLWFDNACTLTDQDLKTWLSRTPHVDLSLYTANHPIYLHRPRFDHLPDPYPERLHRLAGVPLVLAAPDIHIHPEARPEAAQVLRDANRSHPLGPIPEGQRNTTLTSMAGALRRRGHTADEILALLTAVNIARCHPPMPDMELATIARSISSYDPAQLIPPPRSPKAHKELTSACKRLADDPALLDTLALALKPHVVSGALTAQEIASKFTRALQDAVTICTITREQILAALERAPAPEMTADPWRVELRTSDTGGFIPDAENMRRVLIHHPAIDLWWDTRTNRATWSKCPWGSAPRALEDTDAFNLRAWLSITLGWVTMPASPHEALIAAASLRRHDPWEAWLEGLVYDGVPRLSAAAKVLLGAQEEIEAQFFRWWMISAVARSLTPGCQAEHMIVFEGAQGSGKTSFLRRLVGLPRYFGRLTSGKIDLTNPRVGALLRGPVIIEMAEMSTVRATEVEDLKSFLDARVDVWTPMFGRAQREDPRNFVFAGTTNNDEYLRDTTGNRRFWPIRTGEIRLDLLELHRAQLWAEAVHLFREGAVWYPPKAIEPAASAHVEQRRQAHPLEELMRVELEVEREPGRTYGNGLRYEPWQLDNRARPVRFRREQIRAIGGEDFPRHDAVSSAALRAIGLVKDQRKIDGVDRRFWRTADADSRGVYPLARSN